MKLFEAKDRFINANSSLTSQQKAEIIAFLKSHPSNEKFIDWNKKEVTSYSYNELRKLLKIGSAFDRLDLSNINKDEFIELKSSTGYYYIPLSYESCIILQGLKKHTPWCIGNPYNSDEWMIHTAQAETFLIVYINNTQYCIQHKNNRTLAIWDAQDNEYDFSKKDFFNLTLDDFIKNYTNHGDGQFGKDVDTPNYEKAYKDYLNFDQKCIDYFLNNYDEINNKTIVSTIGNKIFKSISHNVNSTKLQIGKRAARYDFSNILVEDSLKSYLYTIIDEDESLITKLSDNDHDFSLEIYIDIVEEFIRLQLYIDNRAADLKYSYLLNEQNIEDAIKDFTQIVSQLELHSY